MKSKTESDAEVRRIAADQQTVTVRPKERNLSMRSSATAPAVTRLPLIALFIIAAATPAALRAQATGQVLTGQAAFTDWNQQSPGVRHKITVADLPEPRPDESVQNQPYVIPRPAGAMPIAPPGFKVALYAGGDTTPMQRADNVEHMARSGGTFTQPRLIMTAPNGDLFLADSGAGELIVLRGVGPDGKAAQIATFASGLDHPFGIAFYPVGQSPLRLHRQRHHRSALPPTTMGICTKPPARPRPSFRTFPATLNSPAAATGPAT